MFSKLKQFIAKEEIKLNDIVNFGVSLLEFSCSVEYNNYPKQRKQNVQQINTTQLEEYMTISEHIYTTNITAIDAIITSVHILP